MDTVKHELIQVEDIDVVSKDTYGNPHIDLAKDRYNISPSIK